MRNKREINQNVRDTRTYEVGADQRHQLYIWFTEVLRNPRAQKVAFYSRADCLLGFIVKLNDVQSKEQRTKDGNVVF